MADDDVKKIEEAEEEETVLDLHYGRYGATFVNPWSTWRDHGFRDYAKWYYNRHFKQSHSKSMATGYLTRIAHPKVDEFRLAIPRIHIDFPRLRNPPKDKVQVTWGGHCSLIIQMEDVTLLTDPVFSESARGVKRIVPSAFETDDLGFPRPDAVLISSCSTEHLDQLAVEKILHKWGHGPRWYAPLQMGLVLSKMGVQNIRELDWWQGKVLHRDQRFGEQTEPDPLMVICTPAQHTSRRGVLDRERALWCSWVLVGNRRRVCYVGGSGYCPVFKTIAKKFGPFDLAALPIGGYEPRWYRQPTNMDPEEAIQAHRDLCSKRTVALRWGTFPIGDEPLDAPRERLKVERGAAGIDPEELSVLKHGETISVGEEFAEGEELDGVGMLIEGTARLWFEGKNRMVTKRPGLRSDLSSEFSFGTRSSIQSAESTGEGSLFGGGSSSRPPSTSSSQPGGNSSARRGYVGGGPLLVADPGPPEGSRQGSGQRLLGLALPGSASEIGSDAEDAVSGSGGSAYLSRANSSRGSFLGGRAGGSP